MRATLVLPLAAVALILLLTLAGCSPRPPVTVFAHPSAAQLAQVPYPPLPALPVTDAGNSAYLEASHAALDQCNLQLSWLSTWDAGLK